jgi:hypothetical protein
MVSSGLLRRVALVRTDVSETPGSSETSVHTRATQRNNPEDTILHSHRRENLKSYRLNDVISHGWKLSTTTAVRASNSTNKIITAAKTSYLIMLSDYRNEIWIALQQLL